MGRAPPPDNLDLLASAFDLRGKDMDEVPSRRKKVHSASSILLLQVEGLLPSSFRVRLLNIDFIDI